MVPGSELYTAEGSPGVMTTTTTDERPPAGQGLGCRTDAASLPAQPRSAVARALALTLGVFLVTLNVTVVVVALPSITAELRIGTDEAAR